MINPLSLAAADISLLKVKSETLDNGLKIYVYENHEAPTVSVQAWVKTGSIHEGDSLGCGLSHYLEHMIFQGSEKYPHDSIVETVGRNGGDMNAYTSLGNTVYFIDILSASSEKAIDILCDAITTPRFPEENFANEKEVILRERAMVSDSPDRVLSEKLWLSMFLANPARHPIIGYGEKIKTVDRQMMLDYYKRRYSPDRTFFVVSGDIESEKAISMIKERLGKWGIGQLNEPTLPSEQQQVCERNSLIHFADPLARIAIGFHVPDASDPDSPALDMLAGILGQDKSSRLVSRIQDERRLAIHIDAFNYSTYFAGIFAVCATGTPEKLEELKSAVFAEISKLKSDDRIKEDELKRILNQITTEYFRALRTNSSVARMIGNSVLTYGTPDYLGKYIELVTKVTVKDLERVADKYITRSNCTVVEMLPETKDSGKDTAKELSAAPVPELMKLETGGKIITLVDSKLPLVDICVVLPGGVIREDKDNAGITRLIASMLTTGTKSYDEKELSSLIDDNAIDIGITGGNNSLVFSMNFHKQSMKAALKVLKSVLSEPAFPESQFAREKENTLKSLASRKLAPQVAAEDRTFELLYGNHPYSRPSAGLESTVGKLTAAQLKDFYFKKCLIPESAVFGIAGDIDKKEIVAEIKKIIDGIPWSKEKDVLPELPVFPKKTISDSVKVPREQSVVMISFPVCDNRNEDRFALNILSKVLNGQTSRLFKTIREESGLAYYTGLSHFSGIQDGFMSFYAGTKPDASAKVAEMLMDEKDKLVKGKALTKDEFESAVARTMEDLAEQKLDKHSLIFQSSLDEYYGNGYMNPWDCEKKYASLKLQDVIAVVKKYFSTDSSVTVISGPGK